MKKVGYLIVFIIIVVVILPIIIIGGIGPGIKFLEMVDKQPVSTEKLTKNSLPSKIEYINVFIKDKIVKMKLEDYIIGVVAAEMPVKFNIEALKAQAVTARTFAVSRMLALGGTGCVLHKGADVCSEIHCQAYMSKEDRMKGWKADEAEQDWEKLCSAVKATESQIISYNGKIANGVKYFSTSNGRTENSLNAFGYKEPYLISVASSNEQEAPNYTSSITISRESFMNTLKKMNSGVLTKMNLAALKIKNIEKTQSGRISKITIGNSSFSGQQIRQGFNLKSTDFNISFNKNNVTFKVKGYGHGVGLSQWGANEMGKRGSNYISIIQHYFTGTKVGYIKNIIKL